MSNININPETCRSQCRNIAQWLREGHTITSLEALQRFGCMRLASRIWDIRTIYGMNIEKRRICTASGKWVTEYRLAL